MTLQYLKNYAYYYFYAIALVLILSFGISRTASEVSSIQEQQIRPVVVIDPGHGGMDGGTTSCTGVSESKINLEISLRLNDLLGLLGYDTVMTRTEDVSLNTQGDTVRAQKQSDLKNRVLAVNDLENAILLSIHQNHFPQSQYSGPQVFYAPDSQSQALAEQMQSKLNSSVAPNSSRTCKKADGVYLMEHIDTTGVLVECGFLSNPTEEAKLQQAEYQKKLCSVIAATMANYIEQAAVS